MSLEQQIGALVKASENLTGAVNGKIGEIDKAVEKAVKAIPNLSKTFYVDAINGNDSGLGDSYTPLKTIREVFKRSFDIPFVVIQLMRGQTHVYEGDSNGVCYRILRNQTVFVPYGSGEKPIFTPKVGNYESEKSNLHFIVLESGSVFFRGVKVIIPNELLPGTTSWYTGFGGSLFYRAHGSTISQEGSVTFGDTDIILGALPLFHSGYSANYRIDLLNSKINADLSSNFAKLYSSTMVMSVAGTSISNNKLWVDLFVGVVLDGSGSPVNLVSNVADGFYTSPQGI